MSLSDAYLKPVGAIESQTGTPRLRILTLLLAVAAAGSAQAHDFWLEPRSYHLPSPGIATATFQIGHGQDRETWAVKPERVVQLRTVGPNGKVDLRPLLRAGANDQRLPLTVNGVHVIVYESNAITSELPAKRFSEYLRLEGLTPALQARARSKSTDAPGREIYSRRAKALVQVGPGTAQAQAHVTAPIGLTLEIVPERNPYALAPEDPLPVRVFYQGRPLAGALVKLTDLERDQEPLQTQQTDSDGRASFRPGRQGRWLLNVVWTRPLSGDPRGDFDTVFSSLSFGYPTP